MTQRAKSRPIVCKSIRNELIERALLGLEEHWCDSSPEALKAFWEMAAEPGGLELLGRLLIEHASDPDLYIEAIPGSSRKDQLRHAGHRVVRCEKCHRRRVGLSWIKQRAPRGWVVAAAFCPECNPHVPKALPEIRTRFPAAAVDQIVAAIDAGFWNDDEERYREVILELEDEALALMGEMFRVRALHEGDDYCGLVGPLYDLFNAAIAYSRYGTDAAIAARFREVTSEDDHPEWRLRQAELEAEEFRSRGNHEMAAEVYRSWDVEPAAEVVKGGAI